MKLKYIFLAIIGAATMAACSDNENEIPTPNPNNENAEVSLFIGVDNGVIQSKADDPYEKNGEAMINRLAIFLFNTTTGEVVAKKDTVRQTKSAPSLDRIGNVIVKLGKYDIIIVANADADIMDITTLDGLKDYQAKLTPANTFESRSHFASASSNMLMVSSYYENVALKALNVDGGEPAVGDELARLTYNYLGDNKAIEVDQNARPATASWYKGSTTAIPLTRLAARVQMESVRAEFQQDLVGASFRLDDIYIVNVRPRTHLLPNSGGSFEAILPDTLYYRGAPVSVTTVNDLIYPDANAIPSAPQTHDFIISYGKPPIADKTTYKDGKMPFWYVFENQTSATPPNFYNTRVVISGKVIPTYILSMPENQAKSAAINALPQSYYSILVREMTGVSSYNLVKRNVVYNIQAVIGGLGSDNPDKLTENAMISATITADPWKVVIHEEWIDDED